MNSKHPLVKGTIILTFAGFLSRIIGFFYRIFLSHTIGAEGIGIYQLTFPISAVCYALTCAGIQTAVSKVIAEIRERKNGASTKDYLAAGFVMSFGLALLCAVFIYLKADWIAANLLQETRCAPLLRILTCSIPLESIHSLCNGYFFGQKQTKVPALSQLIEQTVRVASVYGIYIARFQTAEIMPIQMIMIGTVVGEAASVLYSVICASFCLKRLPKGKEASTDLHNLCPCIKRVSRLAAPLSFGRVVLNLLSAAEAIYIPNRLMQFGYSSVDALSTFGVLTGMALPVILFPSAIANSASVILLPMVSESDSRGKQSDVAMTVRRCLCTCLALGFFSTIGFLIFGELIGRILFQNSLVGDFIMTLSFICPFLYLNTTLSSIMHGLGQTTRSFLFSLTGIGIRILFVLYVIPQVGIKGYLYGLLISQICTTGFCTLNLRKYWQ